VCLLNDILRKALLAGCGPFVRSLLSHPAEAVAIWILNTFWGVYVASHLRRPCRSPPTTRLRVYERDVDPGRRVLHVHRVIVYNIFFFLCWGAITCVNYRLDRVIHLHSNRTGPFTSMTATTHLQDSARLFPTNAECTGGNSPPVSETKVAVYLGQQSLQ
jgi:hypothetical protein